MGPRRQDERIRNVTQRCFGGMPRSLSDVYEERIQDVKEQIADYTPGMLLAMQDFLDLHRRKQVLQEKLADLFYEEEEDAFDYD